jgi:ribonucleoside-diphosphate reductase beta chain
MKIIIFSKIECTRCDEAVQFCEKMNIQYEVTKVKNRYEVAQLRREHQEDILQIQYFPIIEANGLIMNYENFKRTHGEPILLPNECRHVLFPIKHPQIWSMYEKAVSSFWTTNEIDFSSDQNDFDNRMTADERYFIKNILAFFAASDGIVNENLAVNFSNEIQIPEARAFYSYQQFNETIHSHTYSLMIDTYVHDDQEKNRLFDGIHTIPSITKKAKWASTWINQKTCPSFAKRLIAFACVEGIMFSGSFCAIFWLKKRGLMHGLSFSNELISRDEGTHQDFAVLMYSYLNNKLSVTEVYQIISEAVEHEKEFITESIPCRLIGMNDILMKQYIEFVADRLLLQLGYQLLFGTANPFDFMENISLTGKTNFFERRVGEYARPNPTDIVDTQTFALDGDF